MKQIFELKIMLYVIVVKHHGYKQKRNHISHNKHANEIISCKPLSLPSQLHPKEFINQQVQTFTT